MSHAPLSQPLRPAGPILVDASTSSRGSAFRSSTPRAEAFSAPRITLHFSARASILGLAPAASPRDSHPIRARIMVDRVVRGLITLLLTLLSVGGAAVVAFGTHPVLAKYPQGLDWITLARRIQWPMTALCLGACVTLIALVVSGKRRAWWLIALIPVLFLFYQRFSGDPIRKMVILDGPAFITSDKASYLKADSQVIGLTYDGQAYAYPCGALALAPVVAHTDADKRLLVMYSPYAGRAQAFVVEHSVKPRELDIVSMPANALLLYNSRIGQFINGFTGTTLTGERPDGFSAPIETRKTSWREWRTLYPDTKVLSAPIASAHERVNARFPSRPVELELPVDARVAIVGAHHPVAMQPGRLQTSGEPLNVTAGGTNLLLFRDRTTNKLKAFDRAVKGDLFPKFTRKTLSKRPEVAFADADTGSLWTADGRCVDGFAKGEQLKPLSIEEDVSYATMKSFVPTLEVLKLQ
jgi:hypothetical protein